jgi:hypothetical protein
MARRIMFPQAIADSASLVSEKDFGGAPFALLVDYLPPQRLRGGRYRVKMQVKLRDGGIQALVEAHGLMNAVVFSDGTIKDITTAQRLQSEVALSGLQHWDMATFLAAMWTWSGAKMAEARAVEITFGRLLQVVEIDGTLDEVSFVAFHVRSAIDKLAAKIATARSFSDGGEVRVYVPGEKLKPVKGKSGTPPSVWGG